MPRRAASQGARAARLNARLAELWPALREELGHFVVPVSQMRRMLQAAGGPCTAEQLGLEQGFYREAIVHSREMRNRFSFLDLAADAGTLAAFAAGEV